MPVDSMPFNSWKALIASCVAGPSIPSTPVFPISSPIFCRASCIFLTSSPVSHLLSSRSTPLKSTIPAFKLLIASFKMSDEIAPFLNAFSKEPFCSTSLSTSSPCDVTVSFSLSSKVLVSIPASFIFATSFPQLLSNAPSNKLFLRSEEALINSLSASDIPVNSSFASPKSPTINCHVFVHPDCAASFKVSNNCVSVFTLVAASFAVCPILIMESTCSSV